MTASEPGPTTFGLIRHALTLWNEEKRIQGLQDTPLSARGREMAEAWAGELQGLPWDRILASDLGRVRETTAIINRVLELPVQFEPLLREQDWGRWSGLSFPELFALHGDEVREQEQAGWEFRPPDGESRTEVLARATEALSSAAARRPGQMILVVCHEGIIKSLLYHLLGRRFLPGEPKILSGYHLHLLRMRPRGLHLQGLNYLSLTGRTP